jgi:hypothetical protein
LQAARQGNMPRKYWRSVRIAPGKKCSDQLDPATFAKESFANPRAIQAKAVLKNSERLAHPAKLTTRCLAKQNHPSNKRTADHGRRANAR